MTKSVLQLNVQRPFQAWSF